MHTLLYIKPSFWCLVVVSSRLVVVSSRLVVVSSRLVVVPGAPASILQPGPQAGTHANSSARRAVSRLNQSCRVRLIDAITLIINYLGAPFGCAFAELFVC